MIGIIDYDAGNLRSVEKALVSLGEEVIVSRDSSEILQADKVILPGVGSFGDAMNNLDKFGLVVLPGKILKIPAKDGFKIPHMGWNSLDVKPEARLFKGLEGNPYVYFVHSYYLKAADEGIVAATTEYTTHIHASVESGMPVPSREEQRCRT